MTGHLYQPNCPCLFPQECRASKNYFLLNVKILPNYFLCFSFSSPHLLSLLFLWALSEISLHNNSVWAVKTCDFPVKLETGIISGTLARVESYENGNRARYSITSEYLR